MAGDADKAEPTLQVVAAHQTDVSLLDLGMPENTIRNVVREIRDGSPAARIIISTALIHDELARGSPA